MNGTKKSAMSIGVTSRHRTRRINEAPAARVNPPSTHQKITANIKEPNDEVERRGSARTQNEVDLYQSSTPPWLNEDHTPRSLEPIVRFECYFSTESGGIKPIFTNPASFKDLNAACTDPLGAVRLTGTSSSHRGLACIDSKRSPTAAHETSTSSTRQTFVIRTEMLVRQPLGVSSAIELDQERDNTRVSRVKRKGNLTMRLSDARVRCWQSKLLYTTHRLPPWLTEDDTPAIARTDC
jgi:hypothetical protein